MLKSQYPKSPVQFSYYTLHIKMDFISWTHSSVPWLGRELPAVRLQMVLLRHGLGHGAHPRQDCGLTGADTVIQVLLCPRSCDPFYTVSYNINWVTTSWTDSTWLDGT